MRVQATRVLRVKAGATAEAGRAARRTRRAREACGKGISRAAVTKGCAEWERAVKQGFLAFIQGVVITGVGFGTARGMEGSRDLSECRGKQ